MAVVSNPQGWYVNISLDRVPWRSEGPFDNPITLTEALIYTASILKLEL